MTSPIETNNVVELLERAKALREECRKGVEDRGVMSDYCDACVALKALAPKLLDAAQSLSDRIDVLSKHVWALEQAEARYRYAHDVLGAGDPKTGRAWDLLHRAGDSARASLAQGGKNG